MKYDIEPLETGVWLGQLRKLARHSQREEEALVASLRRGFHLAELAPRPLRHMVACSVTEAEFEQLLGCRALLAAALALVGDRLNYSLTQVDCEDLPEAEVWFPNEHKAGNASSRSAASAVFKAWLECLSALDESACLDQWQASPPIPRRSQFGRRPKSTEH